MGRQHELGAKGVAIAHPMPRRLKAWSTIASYRNAAQVGM